MDCKCTRNSGDSRVLHCLHMCVAAVPWPYRTHAYTTPNAMWIIIIYTHLVEYSVISHATFELLKGANTRTLLMLIFHFYFLYFFLSVTRLLSLSFRHYLEHIGLLHSIHTAHRVNRTGMQEEPGSA